MTIIIMIPIQTRFYGTSHESQVFEHLVSMVIVSPAPLLGSIQSLSEDCHLPRSRVAFRNDNEHNVLNSCMEVRIGEVQLGAFVPSKSNHG